MDVCSNNIFIFSFFLFFHSCVGRRHSIRLFVGTKHCFISRLCVTVLVARLSLCCHI